MSTYYGFNEREKLKPIDWNSITRDINQKIDTEIERRDTLKADVEEFGREYRKKLNQAPMGDSDTINNWVTEAAGQLGDNFKMIDDQLKSGRLKYKDYIRLRANMNEGVDTMISLAGRANEIYSDKFERMELDESSVLEQVLMDKTIALADFANSAPVIDPDTGNFSLVRRDKNGNIIPGDIISFTNYRNMSSWKGNKFDVNEFADEKVEDLVAKARYQEDLGGVIDIRDAKGYDAWLTDTANSLNDYQKAEILARAKGYELTDDRSLRDSNDKKYVLYELRQGRPVVDFTGDQQTDADRAVKDAIDVRLSRIYGTPVKTTTGSGTSKDKQDDLFALQTLASSQNVNDIKLAGRKVLTSSNLIPEGAINVTIDVKGGEPIDDPNRGNISDRIMTYSYEDEKGRAVTDEVALTETGIGLLAVDILEVATVEDALPLIMKGGASGTTFEAPEVTYEALDDYNQDPDSYSIDNLIRAIDGQFRFVTKDRKPEGFEVYKGGPRFGEKKVIVKKDLGEKGSVTIELDSSQSVDSSIFDQWLNLSLDDLTGETKKKIEAGEVVDVTKMLTETEVLGEYYFGGVDENFLPVQGKIRPQAAADMNMGG
jgi:hypothetical protein